MLPVFILLLFAKDLFSPSFKYKKVSFLLGLRCLRVFDRCLRVSV